MNQVPNLKLANGQEIPMIGLGTYQNFSKPEEVYEAVKAAIEIGYRHIDCALIYMNEPLIGKAIKEKIEDGTVKREDLYITSKCWNTFHRRHKVVECCKRSLSDLQLDYVDQYLIHWPFAYLEGNELYPKNEKGEKIPEYVDITETWQGMEDCYELGLVKTIGLSNFNSEQIERIMKMCKIKITVIQVECHPYLNQHKLLNFCKERDISMVAYCPLGSPDRPWHEADKPTIFTDTRIKAIADKHNKSPAQVVLRWNIQRGVVVIPKSVTEERIRINMRIFDFKLSEEEMAAINGFKEKYRFVHNDWLRNDKNYPFSIEF